jgi:predicted AlkP superfamily pyrophosphatase or phosphodiesterase
LRQSPYGNSLTFNFSKQLIINEKLGKSPFTDMLCVSLSSTDYVGHRFGPNSIEVEDMYIRLDKDLENFLTYLDKTIGGGNYLFFLSADHGAPNVPDFMKQNKMPGGSVYSYGLSPQLNKMLLEKFGVNNLVRAVYEYQVYLDNRKIDSLKLDGPWIRNEIVQFLIKLPEVVNAFDYRLFSEVVIPLEIREKISKGFYLKRSGDIQFILKPQYTDVFSTGTEHGTMYAYDTHIPLVWFGWKIKTGKSSREVHMTDIAPTISNLLQIQMPSGSIGKPLVEITGN